MGRRLIQAMGCFLLVATACVVVTAQDAQLAPVVAAAAPLAPSDVLPLQAAVATPAAPTPPPVDAPSTPMTPAAATPVPVAVPAPVVDAPVSVVPVVPASETPAVTAPTSVATPTATPAAPVVPAAVAAPVEPHAPASSLPHLVKHDLNSHRIGHPQQQVILQGGHVYNHAGHAHLTDPASTIIQHGGHTHTLADAEEHGGLIFSTMLITMCLAQLALVLWKKHSQTTFDQATLAGLWLFPIGYSIWHGILAYARMIVLWTIFSIVCGVVMRQALSKPIARTTPRLVYKYFYAVYRISYGTAVAGYVIMMLHFLGFADLAPMLVPSPATAILLGFYGLYFGVLGRDLANVCSQSMAVSLGYVGKRGEMPLKSVPVNVCAICDAELIKSFRPTAAGTTANEPDEPMHTLDCGHQFHDFCLRGWTMIGKRDTCANCNEKVRLKATRKQPWETTSIAWAWLLDALWYLLVYNPLVLVLAQAVLYLVY